MRLPTFVKISEKFISDNAPAILTGVAVVGSAATAVLGIRAGMEAKEKLIAESDRRHQENGTDTPYHFDTLDKAKIVWLDMVPPIATAATTMTCIVFAHRINANRAAALAAVYAMSSKRFAEYRDEVLKRDAILADDVDKELSEKRIKDTPRPVFISSGGHSCFDDYSGRYFTGDQTAIRQAVNDINFTVIHDKYAKLSDFYDAIGLDQTAFSEEMGWTQDCPLEVRFTTFVGSDDQPVLNVKYDLTTVRGWDQLGYGS